MDNERVLLKILESIDKVRMNTDMMVQLMKGAKIPLPKRDHEIDELLGKRKTLSTEKKPLDDTI